MARVHEHDRAGPIPFWIHQLVELLLGALLLVEGARANQHTAVVVTLGALLVLLALCSDGPLSAWPWIGRRVHRALDLVAAAVLAVSPLVLSLDGVLAIAVLELAAAGMVWLAVRTNWRPKAKARRQRAAEPERTPTPAAAPPSPPVAR